MMLRLLLGVAVVAGADAAETPRLILLDSGASRDIEYAISRPAEVDGRLEVRLHNRTESDVRVTFTILGGVGENDDVRRTVVIPKNGNWPESGTAGIASAILSPGMRIDTIDIGRVTDSYIDQVDAHGLVTQIHVLNFVALDDVRPAVELTHRESRGEHCEPHSQPRVISVHAVLPAPLNAQVVAGDDTSTQSQPPQDQPRWGNLPRAPAKK